jgi:hypothetical protein
MGWGNKVASYLYTQSCSKMDKGRGGWLTFYNSTTQKAEIRGSKFEASSGKKLAAPHLKG